jgi:hypothetical protein
MKLYINHPETSRVKDIVSKLVNAAGRSVLIEKPDIDKGLIEEVVKVVKNVMSDTMDTLLLGASSVIVEFDIENAVGQAFENVTKLIKWEREEDQLEEETETDQTEEQD